MSGGRKVAGARASAAGKLWEAHVQKGLERQRLRGLVAWWEHNQALFRCVGRGQFLPVASGKSDFSGQLLGGLAFALEAKTSATGSCARSEFTEGEVGHLDAVHRGGGLSLVALEYRLPLAPWLRFVLPWERVPWRRSAGGASVRADDLAGWELHQGERGGVLRFVRWCAGCQGFRLLGRANCCAKGAT